jgi:hypothetical protein
MELNYFGVNAGLVHYLLTGEREELVLVRDDTGAIVFQS